MSQKKANKEFLNRIRRGRKFEVWERSKWGTNENKDALFEASSEWEGKRGRIDIKLHDSDEGHTVVVELKATNWNKIKGDRVRSNALRHARQIWRYIEAELRESPVLPAIIYPHIPKSIEKKEEVESILNERLIQVVWRDLDSEIKSNEDK